MLARKLGVIINLDDITHIDFLKDACGFRSGSAAGIIRVGFSLWARTSWTIRETPSTV